jgi:glycosyltransferase involved in cell wall biosynthesis
LSLKAGLENMRVCFIVNEIFHWGLYGGFGKLTRTLGANLAMRGVEVYVLMPRISVSQRTIETLDGMIVLSPLSRLNISLFKTCDADIYHSQSPGIDTYWVMKMNPGAKHIITFQDPMTIEEEKMSIWSKNPRWRTFRYRAIMELKLRAGSFITKRAIHKADALFSQAKYIIPKIVSMYGLNDPPAFLPNPVEIPNRPLKKASEPTVCFLARWDPVKRHEVLFDLAEKFPDVKFIAPGKAHDKNRDEYLRKRGKEISNLEMPGFVSEEEKSRILEKSWILVNTSLRECLPVSFLEAAAHKCVILSSNNPDGFAENFGYYVTNGDYAEGLAFLLKDGAWKERGEKGYRYVKETHQLNRVINLHMKTYEELLDA